MPLDTQLAEIILSKGLDKKTNAKLVLNGYLTELENALFTEGGSLSTRPGFQKLSKKVLGTEVVDPTTGAVSQTLLDAASALATLDDELLLFSKGRLYSWSPGGDAWANKGPVSTIDLKATGLVRNTYSQSNPDIATTGNHTIYAWSDTRGGVYLKLVDEKTKAECISDLLVDVNGARPRCFTIGPNLYVLWISTVAAVGTVKCAKINIANDPTALEASVSLEADAHATLANQHLEVASGVLPQSVVFAYTTAAGHIKVGYLTPAPALGLPTLGLPDIVDIAVSGEGGIALVVREIDDSIYVFHVNATPALKVFSLYQGLTQKTADSLVETASVKNVTAIVDDDGNLREWHEISSAEFYDYRVKTSKVSAATLAVSGLADACRSVGLASKAFQHQDGLHVWVVHDPSPDATHNGLQNSYFLLRDDGTIVAKSQYGTADRLQAGALPSVVEGIDSDHLLTISPIRTQFVTGDNTTYSLVGLARLDLAFNEVGRTAQVGDGLVIAGGVPGYYDGQGVTELGFNVFIENVSVVSAAGGSLEAGTRAVSVVASWYDAKGQRHQSAPSLPVEVTSLLNDKLTVTIPTIRITGKRAPRTNIILDVYTTEADAIIFLKTPNDPATDPNKTPLYNDPTADTVTFVRKIADTGIVENEILYTQGGPLEDVSPASSSLIASTKRRLLLAGTEDRRRVFFSKEIVKTNGPETSDALYFDVDQSGGELATITAMDDKIVLGKERQIELVEGDGPDVTGANGSFSIPALVTTDIGMPFPDSVAATPAGLVFKTAKGIYLLSRSLEASYIGAPVEAYNALAITGATLVENRNEVWFATDGGIALAWNYFFNQWSVQTVGSLKDLLVWQNTLVGVDADGTVIQETPDAFVDGGVAVRMKAVTGWIKFAGLQGFQRVRRFAILGDYITKHKIRVRVGFDYQKFYAEQHTWDPETGLQSATRFGEDTPFGAPVGGPFGAGASGLPDDVYQFRCRLGRQKCEAIRFEIEIQGSTPGAAVVLNALSLEVALKKGIFKMPAGKTVG
jgi:hypothetical protein